MGWEIKNRFTGEVIKSGDGEMKDANLGGADFRSAYLAGADLGGAYLRGAYLRDADFRSANLGGADLGGAYLACAYFGGACLAGADLIDLGQRSDGYQFHMQPRDGGEPMVLAGCRYFPLSKARAHWDKTRPAGTPLGDETRAILDHGERLMAIRFPVKSGPVE